MTTSLSSERALLGAILLDNSVWPQTETLTVEDFSLDSHRRIYSYMAAMFQDQRRVDLITIGTEFPDLDKCGGPGYLADLVTGCLPENAPTYVREVSEAARERQYERLYERLDGATETEARVEILKQMQGVLAGLESSAGNKLIVIRGDEAPEKPLRWMWKPYLPMGKLVHFGGMSSQAKSPVTVDLAARISIGADWPDGTANVMGPRSVILLNIEDDLEDTILPRFRLAGGDKTRLHYVKGTWVADASERGVILAKDMQKLSDYAQSLPDLGLIIIDPITNYLGSSKMNAEEQVRPILTPLASLAAKRDIVVITVGHFNRREKGTDPLHRMMGASAFTGVARAVYTFGPDPDDESKFSHVMTVVRGCGGEGSALRYRTELVQENCPDSFSTEIIKVVWTGKSEATAQDSVDPISAKDKAQVDEAASVLRELLRDGKRPATECIELLKAEGYDLDKLNAGRVRRKAGAESKRIHGERFNSWYLVASE